MRTTEEIIDSIDNVLERPVIGAPTIQSPNERVLEDYDNPEPGAQLSFLRSVWDLYRVTQEDLDSILEANTEALQEVADSLRNRSSNSGWSGIAVIDGEEFELRGVGLSLSEEE